ncbi:MAG: hypothetical protein HYU28_02025 [Actinobacteria bacterium]|nr:hypothetical protein [Actinomycetota bacterium]
MRTRRIIATMTLAAFMLYTAGFFFVYLRRSFAAGKPPALEYVGLYHGDNFSRVILVGLLFLIGEVFVVYLAITSRRPHRVDVRVDLWRWLRAREELTGEPADVIAERAIAQYRLRLEGGPGSRVPSAALGADATGE